MPLCKISQNITPHILYMNSSFAKKAILKMNKQTHNEKYPILGRYLTRPFLINLIDLIDLPWSVNTHTHTRRLR